MIKLHNETFFEITVHTIAYLAPYSDIVAYQDLTDCAETIMFHYFYQIVKDQQ